MQDTQRKLTPRERLNAAKERAAARGIGPAKGLAEPVSTGPYVEDTTNADLARKAAREMTYSPEIAKAQTRTDEPWYLMEGE